MAISSRSPYVVVGAGIHGLSTAYHLAKELRTRKLGSGRDVLVLDKSTPGAGASGIACGVVRNNYFQPAMSELMQACVEVWESDPAAYHYNPVGYIALMASVLGLAKKCESEDVTIYPDVEVREFEFASDESVKTVVTDDGSIEVGEQLVLAPGPWA